MKKLDSKYGCALVKLARKIVVTYLKEGVVISVKQKEGLCDEETMGGFLTAKIIKEVNNEKTERVVMSAGCPLPLMSLRDIVVDSAINMAIQIRSRSLLNTLEIKNLIFEIDVLTPLRIVDVEKPTDYLRKIRVGRDGLMVERGFFRVLLLPKVPLEKGWDAQDFLSECCVRAGYPPDAWLYKNVNIYAFQSQIFKEVKPLGKIIELSLDPGAVDP